MNQTAKKGDMALVIGYISHPEMLGRIVEVTSDPFQLVKGVLHRNFGRSPAGAIHLRSSVSTTSVRCTCGEIDWAIPLRFLIPIRDPDADITRTTEREVAA